MVEGKDEIKSDSPGVVNYAYGLWQHGGFNTAVKVVQLVQYILRI